MNCFRYLDFKSFAEVDRLSLDEYELLMKSARLKEVDMDYRIHMLAFLNTAVTATKPVSRKEKPIYDKFEKFYNYEKEITKAMSAEKEQKTPGRFDRLSRFLKGKGQDDG